MWKLQWKATQDRQSLILGDLIKVLKVGKIIQLNAERKKLCKGAGETIPHIQHEPVVNEEWGNISNYTCHIPNLSNKLRSLIKKRLILLLLMCPGDSMGVILSILIYYNGQLLMFSLKLFEEPTCFPGFRNIDHRPHQHSYIHRFIGP